jgi:hypothetical protein
MGGRRSRVGTMPAVVTALLLALILAACGGASTEKPLPAPSRSGIRTLSPLPVPPTPPATGRLFADMRQSSLDVALGQMQVWVRNDTRHDLRPTRIVYTDGRFSRPLSATRLRTIPSRHERGYPIALPARPVCDSRATHGTLQVWYGGHSESLRVSDETDVPGRYLDARCQELAVSRVAHLSWSDRVRVEARDGKQVGVLRLLVRPTGRGDGSLRIETVSGTPMISTAGGEVWRPGLTVRSTDPPTHVDLDMQPARCDDHVFMEGGGGTAFKIGLTVDGQPADILVRMSGAGAAQAISYVREACGKE